MSDELQRTEAPRRRSGGARALRAVAWIAGSLLLVVVVLVGALTWYSTTPDFERRVGKEVVGVLEDATGGRVELGRISLNLWHLAIEVDGLVIHGLERPGEAPYLSADRILVRLKLNTILSHTVGKGAQSHVGLNFLRVEQPHVHLIIDKDGKTNQPVPKHPSTSTEPLENTLLDLQAKEVELANGLAVVNDRAIPFDVAARDLNARVQYLASVDRYGATIDLNDLRTRMAKEPEAQSRLHVEAQIGRDMAELTKLDLHTGAASELLASGSLEHFARPEWKAAVEGSLELKQIAILGGVDGLNAGSVELKIKGHNCYTPPAEAQKQPHFWERRHPNQAKTDTKALPPDPDCTAGYLVVGDVKLHNAGYRDQTVRLHDINGGAQLHVTPTELLFTALTGYLPGGGSATGELRISNWLGEVPAQTAASSPTTVAAATTANKAAKGVGAAPPVQSLTITPVQRAHAVLNVKVDRITLRAILAIAGPEHFGDLGFDTMVSGPVKAEWGGPATDIADTVNVDADLRFQPTGARPRGVAASIPVSGEALAHYRGQTQVVNIERLVAQTPQSTLDASGVLGVNKGDPLTSLRVDLSVRDLGEYDQLLQTLGFQANGKKGSAAIPVVLHGSLGFNGTAKGAIANLDVKGHLQATDLAVQLGTEADVHIDSVVADAEYAPRTGLAVASSTIKRGSAVLNVSGAAQPRKQVSRRGVATYVWDDGSTVDAKVQLNNAQLADVLEIAGQKGKYPVTGTLSLNGNAAGTLKSLNGGAQISLTDGVAYGERFESMTANATVKGKDIEASSFAAKLHGMQIAGNGGYDMATDRVHAHVEGDNLVLSKFDTVQAQKLPVDGTLSLIADANGTLTEPGLKANVRLANLVMNGQALGQATADIHSQGKLVYYTLNSSLTGATLVATGQTSLVGNYDTQAKLTLTGLDVSKPMAIFAPNSPKVTSSINGVVTVNGPLKTPQALRGTAELSPLDVVAQGFELKADGPLRASLQNGVATLEPLHITGQETDLRASGTVQLLGVTDPKGGAINVKATGSVGLALLHTFDKDVISSGKVEFEIAAGGKLKSPSLTGNVQFEKGNLALDGVSNGLSDLNGTLVFNEDRLAVKTLTATSGGGKLTVGGYVTYSNGGFANITLNADTVRVRYNGLSGTANAKLTLQGTAQNALLSGNVLLTRFGIGPDVDFAAFAGSGGVSAPPDPNSPLSKLQLDIHATSSPQLDFQNSYAKIAGTVDLTVRGTAAEPSVLGRIQITDGSATFAGTKYSLQRGDIYFSNPVRIDPIIDLDAIARVENYDITIGVHGTTSNLKPTYRSEPPLSEADIFNLLALGRTQEEAQLYSEQQTQAGTDPTTSALLGGALNATVSNRVSKLFGGGSVKIDPSYVGTLGTATARITIQQQLSRQLSVTFATDVNSSQQQLIQVTYALNENQSLVVTRDETGVFSIVYKLRKRYR